MAIVLETSAPIDPDYGKGFLSAIRLRFSPDKLLAEVVKDDGFNVYVDAEFDLEEVITALEFQGLVKRV